MSDYLVVEDVAELLHVSKRSVHELTRTGQIPHRRVGGTRRCLFVRDELEAWLNGATLEVQTLPNGGRAVKPQPAPKLRSVA